MAFLIQVLLPRLDDESLMDSSSAPIHLLKEHQKPSTAGLLDFRASLREREKNPPKFSFFTEGSKVLTLLCQF